MSLVDEVNRIIRSKDFQQVEESLKWLEKFDDIQPERLIWGKQRLLQRIRNYIPEDGYIDSEDEN